MPPTSNGKLKVQKYSCPNPNCKTLFSRPKVIRYYVCPTCQTLVDDTNVLEFDENEVASKLERTAARKEPKLPKKPKVIEATEFSEKAVTEVEATKSDQSKLKELFDAWMSAEKEESKAIMDLEPDLAPQEKTAESPQPKENPTVEIEEALEPSSGKQSCFGYLGHREKGAAIPDTCIECPDSLNCMLSQYHKSGASVREISKWYK